MFVSERERTDVGAMLKKNLEDQLADTANNTVLYSVLDQRVAHIDASGVLRTVETDKDGNITWQALEGRTAVYARCQTAFGIVKYAVIQLEVRDQFYLSSGPALGEGATE